MVPAKAATFYSSLGAGGSFSSSGKYGIDGGTTGFSFQTATSGTVDTISLALAHEVPPVTLTVGLYQGTGSTLGTLLETYSVPVASTTSALLTVNSALHPFVQPGTTYWLTVQDPGTLDGDRAIWNFNGQGTVAFFGPIMNNGSVTSSGWYAAFQVDGTATPEPAMGGLVLCGLLAMGAARFRK